MNPQLPIQIRSSLLASADVITEKELFVITEKNRAGLDYCLVIC